VPNACPVAALTLRLVSVKACAGGMCGAAECRSLKVLLEARRLLLLGLSDRLKLIAKVAVEVPVDE